MYPGEAECGVGVGGLSWERELRMLYVFKEVDNLGCLQDQVQDINE